MRIAPIAIAATAALVPLTAFAVGPVLGELRGSIGAEAEWSADNTLLRGAAYDISPDFDGSQIVDINTVSHSRAFGVGAGANAELSYGVSDDFEIFGRVGWLHNAGNSTGIGTYFANGEDPRTITAAFEDTDTYSAEIGARYYVGYGNYRPFFGVNVGARFADEVRASVSVFNMGTIYEDLVLYDSSTLFSGGVESGIAFGNDDGSISGMVSVGLKYVGSLDSDDSDLHALGVSELVSHDGQLLIPVRANLSMRF